ncbi:uncharacterized protein LOC111377040, partial [Olea europaea var. sylvestris]|uniref:uncharacterized protein LOC111377040 n=1 Tax=Olea europaea var. sylvestris TaxID=158386 RepID=UPI000C1D1F5D
MKQVILPFSISIQVRGTEELDGSDINFKGILPTPNFSWNFIIDIYSKSIVFFNMLMWPSKGNSNLVTRSFQKDKVTRPSHLAEVLLNWALHPPRIYSAGQSGKPFGSCCGFSYPRHLLRVKESFGDKWNGSFPLNPGSESDLAICNGFYHGSVSRSKEPVHLPSSGFDFLKCGRGDNVASECLVNPGFEKFLNGDNHLNLNGVTTQSSPNEAVSQKYFNMVDRNSLAKDQLSVFPWLGCKPVDKKEAAKARKSVHTEILGSLQASSDPFCFRSETVRDLNQVFTPNISLASDDCVIGAKEEIGKSENGQKILGFPIFEILNTPKHESSPLVSTLVTLDCPSEGNNIDAEELIVENKQHSMGTIIRSQIDLNTCITDDEDPFAPFVASNSANVKIVIKIDLEAPIRHEMEDDIIPSTHLCNVLKIKSSRYRIKLSGMQEKQYLPSHHLASKFVVSIQFVTCQKLLWQNQSSCSSMLSSCASELKGKDDAPIQGLPMEMDNFEAMALQLTETKEKDYMPKPLVPEVLKVEEMGATLLP